MQYPGSRRWHTVFWQELKVRGSDWYTSGVVDYRTWKATWDLLDLVFTYVSTVVKLSRTLPMMTHCLWNNNHAYDATTGIFRFGLFIVCLGICSAWEGGFIVAYSIALITATKLFWFDDHLASVKQPTTRGYRLRNQKISLFRISGYSRKKLEN